MPTEHALYKLKEYYIPVYDRASFPDDMLCYVCKLRPIYKPWSRLGKKLTLRRYESKCLQCFIEHKLSVDSKCFDGTGPTPKDVLSGNKANPEVMYKSILECSCNRNYYYFHHL